MNDPASRPPVSVPRYATLDAWRGVACLMVLGFHAAGAGLDASHGAWWFQPLWWLEEDGFLGVQVFFVVSGFCIAASAAALDGRPDGRAVFLRRRFVRIYPTYWVAMAFVAALGWVAAALERAGIPQTLDDETRIGWHWLSNLALVEAPLKTFGVQPLYGCGVIWSLCYEVQFYALVALAAVGRSPRARWAALLVVTAASVLVRAVPSLRPHGFLLDVWLEFAAGLWVFARLSRAAAGRPVRALDLLFAAAVAANVLAWLVGSGRLGQDGESVLFCAAVAALLVFLHRYDAPLSRAAPVRALAWVGDRSYSVYLLHLPIVRSVIPALARPGWTRAGWLYPSILGTAALSVAAAHAFHEAVEKRFLARKPAAAAAAAA